MNSLKKLAALPAETVIYCGHEYTLANARFALTVDPTNSALEGARRQDRGAARRRQADAADDDRRGTVDQSVPALARSGDPQASRHGEGLATPRCSPRSASARTISEPDGIVETMTSSAEIIAILGLKPHPEGGWYAETFRDGAGGARGHSTAIYFLLEQDQVVGLAPGQGRRRGLAFLCRRATGAVDVGGRQRRDRAGARHRAGGGRAAADRRAGRLVAIGAQPRRMDAGRLHRRAGL